ncbi:hypothetical protein V6N13_054065 [Hibiscus sabdariffa]|uniref:Uncharacterized protein n=1 Tax=Hibiscus sabdariffa TaxID=183260 RepID=A0ABR2T6K1_9ROSI
MTAVEGGGYGGVERAEARATLDIENVGPGGRPPDGVPVEMDHEGSQVVALVQGKNCPTNVQGSENGVGVRTGDFHNGMLNQLDEEMRPKQVVQQDSDVVVPIEVGDGRPGESLSYASITASTPIVANRKIPDWKEDFDNVVILEADYIIDRSESCGLMQPALPSSNLAGDGVDNSEEARTLESSENEPFGPWMQVSSQRHKHVSMVSGMESSRNRGRQSSVPSGSRFVSLAEDTSMLYIPGTGGLDAHVGAVMSEDGRQSVPTVGQTSMSNIGGSLVSKNAAYKASNPEKRSKSPKSGLGPTRVVSVVHEKEHVVSTQRKTFGNEHHKAVTIVEQPIKSNGATGGKIIKERGAVVRNRTDGVCLERPGVRFRKANSSSTTTQPTFYEWMQEFAKELEGGGMVVGGTSGASGEPIATVPNTRQISKPGDSVDVNAKAGSRAGNGGSIKSPRAMEQ